MTSHELKEYLLQENRIEILLNDLGCRDIEFHTEKSYYTSTQPNEDSDNKMGVVIKCNDYLSYYSYSHNIHIEENRDIFYLIEESKDMTFSEVMRYVHKLFGLKFSFKKEETPIKEKKMSEMELHLLRCTRHERVNRVSKKINVLDTSYLKDELIDFTPDIIHFDLYKEGIMPWTVKKFGLGYSFNWKRTIFPHHYWSTGELIGYNARTSIENYDEFGIKKYYLTPHMPKEMNLYGYWENQYTIRKAGYVVVYESEKSTLKRHSKGDGTGVSISGHSLSDEQATILLALNVDIIISMDNDVPIQEVRHMCEKLYKGRRVFYTVDKHNLLPPKSSVADANNLIFDFIMKYKVPYDESEHQKYLKEKEKKEKKKV